MKAYADIGQAASVHRHFRQLAAGMQLEFDEQPGAAITAWYHQFRSTNAGQESKT